MRSRPGRAASSCPRRWAARSARRRSSTTSCASRRPSRCPVMIQDAPAYLGVGLGPELVRQIGAAGRERAARQARGRPGGDERLDRAPRRPSSRSGAATAASTCSTACAPARRGSSPASTWSTSLVRVYEAEARGRAARSPRSASARSCRCSCSRCSTRSTTTTRARSACSSGAASSSTPRCARPRPRSATCPGMLLERHLAGLQLDVGRRPCRLTRLAGASRACASRNA